MTTGLIKPGYTISLAVATWTAVVSPDYPIIGFRAWTSSGNGFKTSYTSTGTSPITITDVIQPYLEVIDVPETGSNILWAQSLAATDTLNVKFIPA